MPFEIVERFEKGRSIVSPRWGNHRTKMAEFIFFLGRSFFKARHFGRLIGKKDALLQSDAIFVYHQIYCQDASFTRTRTLPAGIVERVPRRLRERFNTYL